MRIAELRLQTSQLAAQRRFYSETMRGLTLLDDDVTQFTVGVGRSRLTFMEGAAARYHFAFTIPHNQLDEAYAWVTGFAPTIALNGQDVFHSDSWNADMFYFSDPAGNILECIARHSLGNTSDAPFSGSSLEAISEIGIAADDPLALHTTWAAELNAQTYVRVDSEFAPLGDDEGVLIIVRAGRIWYPETGVPALSVPTGVVLEDGAVIER